MIENLHVSFGKESPIAIAGAVILGILMLVLNAALSTEEDSNETLHDKLKEKEKKLKEKEEKLKKIEEQLRGIR